MPRGLMNWAYKDVCSFLKYYGFEFGLYLGGSHESWINKKIGSVVEVNKTKSSYPPRTLETMIRQSKIIKDIWRDWAGGAKHDNEPYKEKSSFSEVPKDNDSHAQE